MSGEAVVRGNRAAISAENTSQAIPSSASDFAERKCAALCFRVRPDVVLDPGVIAGS
jgi:hypothetical protein